jgi:hypothetical protein
MASTPQDVHGRPIRGTSTHPYPYHYPVRMLTTDELKTIKQELEFADRYVQHYRYLFEIENYHGVNREVLERKYTRIGESMLAMKERGDRNGHYTKAQKTPLMVADTDRYLKEIIQFAAYRADHPDESSRIPDHLGRQWKQDQAQLVRMEHAVHDVLLSISPHPRA